MTAKRGRPVGTKRRAEAIAAARAILAGQFADVREAATALRPARIGSDEGFRDFIATVEEELHAIAEVEPVSIRAARASKDRGRNRRAQPIVQRQEMNATKRHINDVLGWSLQIRDPN
ncbi:MAG: hypothetical protein J0I47_00200 [Sphingomonas sp.]|uniref:hypothetical protein n=1 Tax=Sphingomonas sp. TaxID=28214 RepID=UPI001ACE8531|nr:hypothetical protein [Sphingomonas sp.]MBN8806649.1 hypothetical protein [Sphingomonas sp.]